jgi:hypothetical protein
LDVTTALDYFLYLSNISHSLNMSFALKNNAGLLKKYPASVLPATDFAVVENGVALQDQASYSAMIKNGKAVFDVEYLSNTAAGGCSPTVNVTQVPGICLAANASEWFVVFKLCKLGSEYTVC